MSLPRPYLYDKNWLVFPNVSPYDTTLNRCGNDVDGKCNKYDKIEDCINECKNSGHCYYGYYISYPEKYCLNVDSVLGAPHYDPTLNWVKNNNSNEKVFAFINKEKFPNNFSNTIYYRDNVTLMNGDIGINTPKNIVINGAEIIPSVTFGKNPTILSIDFSHPYSTSLLPSSDIINNEKFILNIKDTGYILRKNDKNNDMIWILRGKVEIKDIDLLRLISVNKGDKDNHISYGEKVYIIYLSGYLSVNNNKLIYNEGDPINSSENIFYFKTNKKIYTCDNGKCIEISRDKISEGISNPKYNGKDTYRSDSCFGVCDYNFPKNWNTISNDHPSLLLSYKSRDFINIKYIIILIGILSIIYIFYIIIGRK